METTASGSTDGDLTVGGKSYFPSLGYKIDIRVGLWVGVLRVWMVWFAFVTK